MKKIKKISLIALGILAILWGIGVAVGVSKHGSWDAYWSSVHSKSEDSGKSDDCCCCIPYEGQIGTCAETKRMSKKRCEDKGGQVLLSDEDCK